MDNDGSRAEDIVRPRRYGVVVRLVVAVLALSLAAASVLTWQLVSERPAHARADGPPSTSTRQGTGGTHDPPPVTKTSTPGSTTTTTTTTTATTAPAAQAGPVRVVEIGDSLGVDLGDAMENTWPSSDVQLTMAARSATGLTNSAYFDWPSTLSGLLASLHPQVVVVFLGANDLQSMVTGSTVLYDGTAAWNAAYAVRVTEVVSEALSAGARVLWVGEPAMQDSFLDTGMARLDGIAQAVVARHPGGAAYLSSNAVLAPDGSFSFDLTGSTGPVQVRTPDGVHLMPAGADLLAGAVAQALANAWGLHVLGQ